MPCLLNLQPSGKYLMEDFYYAGGLKALRSKAELSLRRAQRTQEYLKEVSAQQTEVQRSIVADEERYRAARDEFERMVIRAPSDGSVVGIAGKRWPTVSTGSCNTATSAEAPTIAIR
mgnify:CR=1 FL=1